MILGYMAVGFILSAVLWSAIAVWRDNDFYHRHPHRMHPLHKHFETTLREEL